MCKKVFKVFMTIFVVIFITIFIAGCLCILYTFHDNSRVVNTKYVYKSDRIPENFNGYRIALITDYHNSDEYEKVIDAVRSANPDIICIVGDLVSMDTVNFTNTKKLIHGITDIATTYYTYGNHEVWSTTVNKTEKPVVEKQLANMGVVFLNDQVKTIEKDGQLINLIGYGDSVYDDTDGLFEPHSKDTLTKIAGTLDKSVFSILLFHRAQYFDMISELPYDLVLSGHLHGGHANIKYIREKILQEHFGTSEYVKGRYTKNGHDMIVSAGIAKKDDMYRIFNTPEIVTVELKCK